MYNETYEAIASDLKKTKQELEAVNNEWMKSLNENDTITKSLSNLTKELGTLKVKHEEEMSFAETKHSLSIESVKRELQDFAHISQKDEEDHQRNGQRYPKVEPRLLLISEQLFLHMKFLRQI